MTEHKQALKTRFDAQLKRLLAEQAVERQRIIDFNSGPLGQDTAFEIENYELVAEEVQEIRAMVREYKVTPETTYGELQDFMKDLVKRDLEPEVVILTLRKLGFKVQGRYCWTSLEITSGPYKKYAWFDQPVCLTIPCKDEGGHSGQLLRVWQFDINPKGMSEENDEDDDDDDDGEDVVQFAYDTREKNELLKEIKDTLQEHRITKVTSLEKLEEALENIRALAFDINLVVEVLCSLDIQARAFRQGVVFKLFPTAGFEKGGQLEKKTISVLEVKGMTKEGQQSFLLLPWSKDSGD